MAFEERVQQLFGLAMEAKMAMADSLSPSIAFACQRLVECLLNDKKILVCGNGGSAANALHFSSILLNYADAERPPLPVMALCADVAAMSGIFQEGQIDQVYARQIHALGQEGDLLLAITTSGNPDNLLQALHAAHERGMDVIVLNGREGGIIANHLGPEDMELRVEAESRSRIHEMHLFILHTFADLIEHSLFGQMHGSE